LDTVLTATLTLLALIVGFTFSMAVSRYDLRKNYEEAEANAIGTAPRPQAECGSTTPTACVAFGIDDVIHAPEDEQRDGCRLSRRAVHDGRPEFVLRLGRVHFNATGRDDATAIEGDALICIAAQQPAHIRGVLSRQKIGAHEFALIAIMALVSATHNAGRATAVNQERTITAGIGRSRIASVSVSRKSSRGSGDDSFEHFKTAKSGWRLQFAGLWPLWPFT
jgi:hypothetical protein